MLKTIADTLQAVGGANLVQRFGSGCFGHLLRMREGPTSARSLISLMTYQIKPINGDDTEIWFGVGGQAIRMSPREYALVTGLNFGSSSFDHAARHEPMGLGTYMRFTGGMRIRVNELLTRFTEKNVDVSIEEDYLKAANILALYSFVLASSERKKIDPWVWVMVDNLALWNRFPWGTYSYGILRHYIREFPTHRNFMSAKLHFYGPWWALKMWALEAIPTLGYVCSTNIAPVEVPRCLRRKFKTLPKTIDLDQLLSQEVQCLAELVPSDLERDSASWISTQIGDPLGVQYIHVDNPIAPSQITADGLHIPRRHPKQLSQRRLDPAPEAERQPEPEPELEPERDMSSSSFSDFRGITREDMREMWRTEFMPELTNIVTNIVTSRMTDIVERLWRSTRGQSRSSRRHSSARSHANIESHGSRVQRSTLASEGGSRDRRTNPALEDHASRQSGHSVAPRHSWSLNH